MKILIVGDVHISPNSSIVRGRGNQFSSRLENCIKSMNWCEQLAEKQNCESIVYLGDTFNKSELNDETITATRAIKFSKKIQHYFLVGNHESSEGDLKYTSVKLFEGKNRVIVQDNKSFTVGTTQIHFIPYIPENRRKPLVEYLNKNVGCARHIVFSHNDLAGIQMGAVISKTGFDINEIENNCDVFINGHLHNGTWVSKKIRNLGILTGQNFGEDAEKYPHNVMILDTDTLIYEDFENPFAFNFYNLSIESEADIRKMSKLKDNSVLSIVYNIELYDKLHQALIELSDKIVEFRLTPITDSSSIEVTKDISELHQTDYLKKLQEYCLMKFGDNDIMKEELSVICGG